jgi:dihydropyrimidinase
MDWDHAARRVMSAALPQQAAPGFSCGPASRRVRCRCVATDHCSFTTAQKRFGVGDFTRIPNGTGGLEDRMPVLWTKGVNTGRLTMNEFVAVTSTNIAKILNMYPKKGAIVEGADADIIVWDPKRKKTIAAKTQQSVIDYNVFEGIELTGLPRFVFTRGELAIQEHEVKVHPGHGEFVAREPHAAVNRALSQWKEITAPRKVERTGIPATGV